MEKFSYKAYDQAGTIQHGEIDAVDWENAKIKLKNQGFIPVKINRIHKGSAVENWFSTKFRGGRKAGLADLELFSAEISLLLKNGIKIDKSLLTVKDRIKNRQLAGIVNEMYVNIRKGEHLSAAIQRYPEIFDSLYVNIIQVGEKTGNLAGAFSRIAQNLAFKKEINSKYRQALVYPLIILIVCLLSVFFIFNFIIPKFALIFNDVENIPVYTRMLLSLSDFVRTWQLAILAGCGMAVILLYRIRNKPWLQKAGDKVVLRLPLINRLCRVWEALRFSSAMASLLDSGVLLSEALELAVSAVGNRYLHQELQPVVAEVRQGNTLSSSLVKTGFMPENYEALLTAGEEAGTLTEIFAEIESRLKITFEDKVLAFVTLVEPLLIIVMGLMVGGVVIMMLLSMVSINDIGL